MHRVSLVATLILLAGCGSAVSDSPTASSNVDASPEGESDAPSGKADTGSAASDGPAAKASDGGARDGKASSDASRPPETTLPETFLGASRCPKGALLCDGFESAALDPAKWGFGFWTYYYTAPRYVTIDVDTGKFARGSRSIHIRQTQPDAADTRDGFLKTKMPFALGSKNLFVRFFIYIDNPTPNRWFPVFFGSDPAKDPPTDYSKLFAVTLVPLSETMIARSVFGLSSDIVTNKNPPGYAAPTGRWACFEFEIHGADKNYILNVDDKPVPQGDMKASYAPDSLQLNFGYANGHPDIIQHPDGFFDLWFDEIAISDQKIGCVE